MNLPKITKINPNNADKPIIAAWIQGILVSE